MAPPALMMAKESDETEVKYFRYCWPSLWDPMFFTVWTTMSLRVWFGFGRVEGGELRVRTAEFVRGRRAFFARVVRPALARAAVTEDEALRAAWRTDCMVSGRSGVEGWLRSEVVSARLVRNGGGRRRGEGSDGA